VPGVRRVGRRAADPQGHGLGLMAVGDRVETFWCEETGYGKLTLRVFTWGDYPEGHEHHRGGADHDPCPAVEPYGDSHYNSGHDAQSAPVFEVYPCIRDEDCFLPVTPIDVVGLEHPAWPTACDRCGAPFVDDVWQRQVNLDPWYRADGRGQWTLRDLPAGAIVNACWMPPSRTAGDGLSLLVICPPGGTNGQWTCDGPSSKGGYWTRTGDPRVGPVTVTPSILTPCYHGYLTAGYLIDVGPGTSGGYCDD
jgi:hypothetical protein